MEHGDLMRRGLRRGALATAALSLLLPSSALADVSAEFSVSPTNPVSGDTVTFTSTSRSDSSPIATQEWDLDNDGAFDDSNTPTASLVFPAAGTFSVGLQVTDDDGARNSAVVSIPVLESRQPPFMTPFPIVRIQGSATRAGARITALTVQAPAGARVRVTCRGKRRGCPRRRTAERTVQARSDGRTPTIRIKRFQRSLRAGAIVRVYVTGDGVIGKYSRFVVRRRRAPARRDLCLMPGSLQPARCPGA